MDTGGFKHNYEGFYEKIVRSNIYSVDIVMYYCGLAIIKSHSVIQLGLMWGL